MLSKIFMVFLIILVVLVVGYVGLSIWSSGCAGPINPNQAEQLGMPCKDEAAYSVYIESSGGLLLTNNYEQYGINAGICQACLVGRLANEQSPDPRYCSGCFDILKNEASFIKTRPAWVPREPSPKRHEAVSTEKGFYLHLVGCPIILLLRFLVGGVFYGEEAQSKKSAYAEAYYAKTL